MLRFASKYEKFWKWFQANENEIFHFEADQERVFDALAGHLCRVHPNLTFEFSSIENGAREFVISAGGIKQAFPEVTRLVREAPALPRWKVISFRQRKDVPEIQCGDLKLSRDEVFFDYVQNGQRIDLRLFLPGFAKASPSKITGLKTIGYLLLDTTIGEYDVETKIAGIEFRDLPGSSTSVRKIPLRELPGVVDSLPSQVQ